MEMQQIPILRMVSILLKTTKPDSVCFGFKQANYKATRL